MAGKSFSALKHGKLNMKQYFKIILMVLIGWLGITASDSDAGIFDKVVRKEAMRRILQRDVARDAATRAIPSATEKKVWRYTSKARAKQEASRGIAAGKHMTSGVYSGRSPSPQTAQKRYGLPKPPEVRETVVIKKGTPVRRNKAIGGNPGMGEVTSQRKLPANSVKGVTPLYGIK